MMDDAPKPPRKPPRRRKPGKPPHPGGRPDKLTPERHAAIVKRVEDGTTFDLSCECEGIDGSTGNRWLDRGQREDEGSKYRAFYEAITRARAVYDARLLSEIQNAHTPGEHGVEDWKARAWALERRRAEMAPVTQIRLKLEGEVARDLLVLIRTRVSASAYAEVESALAGAGGGEPEGGAGAGQ